MANKYNTNLTDPQTSVIKFLGDPKPQYVPLSDVAFGPLGVVLPQPLPPTSMEFLAPQFNKMLNIPSVGTIYDERRNGVTF